MPGLDTIAATIQEVAVPGAKPKEIIARVRERHPGASKKDVVRAAFYALTGGLDADPDKAKQLHGFAIEGRVSDEDDSAAAPKPSRRTTAGAKGARR